MRIVNFTPGLGNQMFEYIFVEYLKKTFPKEKVYGYYNPNFLNKHNGLEIHKIFDLTLPPATKWSNVVAYLCRVLARLVPTVKATDKKYSDKAIYYDGWWQDKKFFLDTINNIKFRQSIVDKTNKELLNAISSSESVSLHVRRGDYLDPQNAKQYGGICTLDYYKIAIGIIKEKYANPRFFVFSNDIEWCKANLQIDNAVFVTNNTGENCWIDMYLMSQCKANILANSSFSYWGAMLNGNSQCSVVYPGKWLNTHTPEIFPNRWMAI